VDQISARGFDRKTVGRILDLVKRNEYKRRQAPPGVRVSAAPSAATGAIPSPAATNRTKRARYKNRRHHAFLVSISLVLPG